MNETTIILTTLMFILGSILYQIQIRLQDSKESILRIMRHYSGRTESLSLYEALRLISERLKLNLEQTEKREYQTCLRQYNRMNFLLRLFGIYVPLVGLGIFFLLFK